jgi:hypothetical protein
MHEPLEKETNKFSNINLIREKKDKFQTSSRANSIIRAIIRTKTHQFTFVNYFSAIFICHIKANIRL